MPIYDDTISEHDESFTVKLESVALSKPELYTDAVNSTLALGRSSEATVTILANDNAFGIFGFAEAGPLAIKEPDSQIEEKTQQVQIVRSKGTFEAVDLYWTVGSCCHIRSPGNAPRINILRKLC